MKRFALTICLAASLVFLFGTLAMAQNTVTVESKNAAMGSTIHVGIAVANAVDIRNIVIPLTTREITPGSYFTAAGAGRTAGGRLASLLSGINVINLYNNPDGVKCIGGFKTGFPATAAPVAMDGVSPDAALFSVGKLFPTDPNLPPGSDPAAGSLELILTVTSTVGTFEIDTTCIDPANHLTLVDLSNLNVVSGFTKGTISIIANACPKASAPTPISAVAGTAVSNQATAVDPEGNPINSWSVVSGPGTISASGLWSYTPTCADIPGFDVTVHASDKGPTGCPADPQLDATFHVNVSAVPLSVTGCGNVSVHWGALASKTINVSGGCPPYTFTGGAPGSVDANGNWTDETNCAQVGDHSISVTVTDAAQQTANCNFTLSVTNDAATCSNPADVTAPTGVALSITMGPTSQADGDALTYAASGTWPAWLSISGNKIVGARPAGDNTPYSVCFTVTDGCSTSQPCCVNVLFESPYQICIVDPDSAAIGHIVNYAPSLYGVNKTVGIWVNPATGPSGGTGGFEFLICYDQSLLRFVTVNRGPNLDPTFEYFTYRTGAFGGNCGGGCPNGYIKIVGIADINNGVTPAPGAFVLGGVIALITFTVDGNVNNIGLCPHVGFCSFDCTDNSLSSKDGYTLYVPSPTDPDITLGADWTCAGNNKPGHNVNPFIDFCAGAICIQRPPDDRGDINLNGVANEIGDAVLFSRYFISGINVFESNANLRQVQILATDINNDGMTLTVADLVYLIRIITGDAQPFPPQGSGFKLSPYANSVAVNSDVTNGSLNIRTNSSVDLGGALFVYHYSGVTVGQPVLAAGTNLQVKSTSANGELRILVYGTAAGAKVPAGLNNLITVPVSGNGTVELAESQVSDASGALLSVNASSRVPTSYALLQNYPNPFNAGTVIQFSLKDQSDWNLSIYNIAGQVVRTFSGNGQGSVSVSWNGTSENGSSVASGMYFYRLTAKDFTATKKMVLMK